MFHFWLILLSAKEVCILRPHRAGPAAGTIHMEIQRGGARVNAQWGVNMQQRIIHIKFRMDQAGLSVKDLEPVIGQPNRVYEVLNHKSPLTLRMIRKWQGLAIHANSPTLCQRRGSACRDAHGAIRGCMKFFVELLAYVEGVGATARLWLFKPA